VRIATVTAHYPPNFISGGTLVPHRIAEERSKVTREESSA